MTARPGERARRPPARMKIGALEEATGVSRDTIHFYVRSGLLHRPNKTGATIAYYDASHVERVRRIRALRAQGISLPMIGRLLAEGAVTVSDADLELVGQLLACTERAEPPRDRELGDDARALGAELGLGALAELDGRLAGALAALASLTGGAGAAARACAAVAVARARAAAAAERDAVVAYVARGDDAGAATRDLRAAQPAVRALAVAARDALLREALEAGAQALLDATARAPRVLALPLGAEHVAAASARLAALDARASAGDPDAHEAIARELFALGAARKLADAARRARRAGAQGPWVALGAGVVALDASDPRAAREAFERALALRPGWGLASALAAAAALASPGDVRGAFAALRALDAATPSDDDAEVHKLWTLLVRALALAWLPDALGRAPDVLALTGAVLARADALPARDPARASGELLRVRGNALLARAHALRALADPRGAAEALAEAARIPGPIGAAALARRDGATPLTPGAPAA